MMTRFLWQGMGRNLRLFVLLVLAIGIVLPLLNQLMPKTSALGTSTIIGATNQKLSKPCQNQGSSG